MRVKKITALVLAAALSFSIACPVNAKDKVERISNPNGSEREVDGFINDRETGYLWAMAERGDDIYIGTWRNTVGIVLQTYLEKALVEGGIMDSETVWDIADVLTNGDIPHITEYNENVGKEGGVIIKIPKSNPEDYKIVFESKDPFRHVALYEDNLYFATYVGSTAGNLGSKAQIYKVDINDNVESVYETAQGASVRANTVFQDHLYFAGTRADAPVKEGDPVALAVLQKHDYDDEWDLVADYKDFGEYAYDGYVSSNAGSPFWDMTGYHDELYVTLPGMRGYAVFKGHPAKAGEEANEYGWVWTEVIGHNNGINNQGMADKPEGYDLIGGMGYLSVISALGVYNDKLYVYDIDHTILAELQGIKGGLSLLSYLKNPTDAGCKISEYLEPVLASIEHAQTLHVMNPDTGKFTPVEGFNELMEGTTNEYVWKHGVHNGEFYISTMDSKVIYNYLTRLTNGSFLQMSEEEWKQQISYIKALIEHLIELKKEKNDADDENTADELISAVTKQLETTSDMLTDLQDLDVNDESEVTEYLNTYESLKNDSAVALTEAKENVSEVTVDALAENVAEKQDEDGAVLSDVKDAEIEPETADKLQELRDEFREYLNERSEISKKAKEEIQQSVQEAVADVQKKISELYEKVDWEGLKMYKKINQYVMDDVQGFDIVKTSDGVNWEIVTDDGFGDKYNYGGLRFASTDKGMYITTANPFYGGQLYLLNNDGETPAEKEIVVDPAEAKWVRGSEDNLTFDTNSTSNWMTVRGSDGKHVGHEGYAIENGKVTLDKSFLDNLNEGNNTFTFVFEDGKADVVVEVVKPETKPEDGKSDDNKTDNQKTDNNNTQNIKRAAHKTTVKTGDESRLVMWLSALWVSLVVMLAVELKRRKVFKRK